MSQEIWIVSDRCFESLSFIEHNTSLPTILSLNIFDWAMDLQSTLHCVDVSKQLRKSDHLAQTELWQTALHNIQMDISHVREILLCKIKEFLPSVNPKILPSKNCFFARKSIDNMLLLFQEAQFGPGTPCWCSYGWSRYHECHRTVPCGELVYTCMGVPCTVKLETSSGCCNVLADVFTILMIYNKPTTVS